MPAQASSTVLLVEDRDAIREILAEALEGEGYAVQIATDGLQALRAVQARSPQAIVLDLMLPGMNGWDFIDAVRQIPHCFHTPIVVMSAASALPRWAAGLRDKGVQAILAKPFELDKLLEAVERCVRAATERGLTG